FVARPRQLQPLGVGAEAAVELGDRELRVVEPIECPEEARRDARREGEHDPSVLEKRSHVCVKSQVTECYLGTTRASAATVSKRISRAARSARSTASSRLAPTARTAPARSAPRRKGAKIVPGSR